LPHAVLAHLGAHFAGVGWVHEDAGGASALLHALGWVSVLLVVALACPNSMQILAGYRPALGIRAGEPAWFSWQPRAVWAIGAGVVGVAGFLSLGQLSEFLYWQF
jgi:hypothetical protein